MTDIDIQKYLKMARKTASEKGKCIDYKRIAELAGIKNAYKVYKHCRDKGLLEIRESNAYIKTKKII